VRYRFGEVELDDDKRILLSPRGELSLQPRVFGLLVHLVRNRDRVVPKEELFESVWEGTFVTDGAVERAVSVLRTTLRSGGAPGAIRTHHRLGYRFCAEVVEVTRDGGHSVGGGALVAARAAFGREAWAEALERFREADAGDGLGGDDLERWGEAAEYSGRLADAPVPLERAVAAYSAAGSLRDAGRAALRLANAQLERREAAVAGGWLRRAERYLSGIEPCHEVALLTWLRARFALFSGDMDEALVRAEAAHDLACRLGDRDVEALGLLYRGLALVASGEVRRGVGLLDESAAAVLAEGLASWTGGIVYCGVIWSCLNRGDWRRGTEWTDQFTRWCSANGVCGYPGLCRLHRAEVLTHAGALAQAEREAEAAARELAEAIPFSEGDAHRVLGEIRLARGDLEGADAAFRRAHELGWDPNPGLALLWLARGRPDAALRCLEGALEARDWSVRQRRGFLLAHLVVIAIEVGRPDRARSALDELDRAPELWETPAVRAIVAQARGELALAGGEAASAVGHLRQAVHEARESGCPFQTATLRLRLAHALIAAEDREGAELEIGAAESACRELGLGHLLASAERVRRSLSAPGRANVSRA